MLDALFISMAIFGAAVFLYAFAHAPPRADGDNRRHYLILQRPRFAMLHTAPRMPKMSYNLLSAATIADVASRRFSADYLHWSSLPGVDAFITPHYRAPLHADGASISRAAGADLLSRWTAREQPRNAHRPAGTPALATKLAVSL